MHVGSVHIHVVICAGEPPEKVMNSMKAICTRRLKEAGLAGERKVWARHGSTRYLWKEKDARDACIYVQEMQCA